MRHPCPVKDYEQVLIPGFVKQIVLTPPAPMPPNQSDGHAIRFLIDYFVPCPTTGDTVLDNRTVRNSLNREWALARNEGKERGGWILQNETTGEYTVWHDPGTDATRNRCSIDFSPSPP